MGIFAPAVVGLLLFRQDGQDLFHQCRLGWGFHQLHRILMQALHSHIPPQAEVTAYQQLVHAVAHMGKTQIGYGVHLPFFHLHGK